MSAISDKFTSFWELEEASGTRVDTPGTNDLADNNTVTQAVGRVGNAAQFTAANAEYLSLADNASISVADIDFFACAWVFFDSLPAVGADRRRILAHYDYGTVNQSSWVLQLRHNGTANRFTFHVSPDGTNAANVFVESDNFGAPSVSTWYFVLGWHDASGNTINIQVNNGTANSLAHTTGVWNSTARFTMGTMLDNDVPESAGVLMDGRIDQAGFGKSLPTADEKTFLYNSGNGRSWADILVGPVVANSNLTLLGVG